MTEHEEAAIDTRLALIERDLEAISNTKRWIQGVAIFLLAQLGMGIWSYAQLVVKVDNIDLTELEQNVNTALTVLGDHGTEFANVRELITRNISKNDQQDSQLHDLRERIDDKTNDRFYRTDGARLEARINRLEDIIFTAAE